MPVEVHWNETTYRLTRACVLKKQNKAGRWVTVSETEAQQVAQSLAERDPVPKKNQSDYDAWVSQVKAIMNGN